MNKTPLEIRNEICKKYGYKDWDDFKRELTWSKVEKATNIIDECIISYHNQFLILQSE